MNKRIRVVASLLGNSLGELGCAAHTLNRNGRFVACEM